MMDDSLVGARVELVSAITFPTPFDVWARCARRCRRHSISIAASTLRPSLSQHSRIYVPSGVDLDGGVDLTYTDLPPGAAVDVGCDDQGVVGVFEVKSARGEFEGSSIDALPRSATATAPLFARSEKSLLTLSRRCDAPRRHCAQRPIRRSRRTL